MARMREPLLIQDQRVIDTEPEENRREAEAHHVESPEDQTARRQREQQNQAQKRNHPEQGAQSPMGESEQQRHDQRGAGRRAAHIVLHAGRNLCDKCRPARETEFEFLSFRRLSLPRGDTFVDPFQPVDRGLITAGERRRLHVDDAKRAVGRGEGRAITTGLREGRRRTGKVEQAQRIVTESRQFIGRQRDRELFAKLSQPGGDSIGFKAVAQFGENDGRLIQPHRGDEFRGIARMLAPRSLPVNLFGQTRFRTHRPSQ